MVITNVPIISGIILDRWQISGQYGALIRKDMWNSADLVQIERTHGHFHSRLTKAFKAARKKRSNFMIFMTHREQSPRRLPEVRGHIMALFAGHWWNDRGGGGGGSYSVKFFSSETTIRWLYVSSIGPYGDHVGLRRLITHTRDQGTIVIVDVFLDDRRPGLSRSHVDATRAGGYLRCRPKD